MDQPLEKKIDGILGLEHNSEKNRNIYSMSVLTKDQKDDFAYIVAFQYPRTKGFRENYSKILPEVDSEIVQVKCL